MKKYLAVLFVFLFGGVATVVQAAPAIVAPPRPAGHVNLMGDLTPDTKIKAGTLLRYGCYFSEVELAAGGWLNVASNSGDEPFANGRVQSVTIECPNGISGELGHGDQDHEPLSTWTIDAATWTPALSTAWQFYTLVSVKRLHLTGYGDSGDIVVYVQGDTTGTTDTATPTPTPTTTSTPVVTLDVTPTPPTTLTPVVTPTPVPSATDVGGPTGLPLVDENGNPIRYLYLPSASK